MSKATNSANRIVDEVTETVRKQVLAEITESEKPANDGKLDMKNSKGGVLMCKFVLGKRAGSPDPLVITVNEEIRWVKRGQECVVPWYVVLAMKNNIERTFTPLKDAYGRTTVESSDGPAEPISYVPLDPAPDNPDWL